MVEWGRRGRGLRGGGGGKRKRKFVSQCAIFTGNLCEVRGTMASLH